MTGEHESAIRWPTASDLQRHGECPDGEPLPAVRVPPYVLPRPEVLPTRETCAA